MTIKRKRRQRVIEHLRRLFPGRWAYDGFGCWIGFDAGFEVHAQSNLIDLNGDGGDHGTYATYHRWDTGERLNVTPPYHRGI